MKLIALAFGFLLLFGSGWLLARRKSRRLADTDADDALGTDRQTGEEEALRQALRRDPANVEAACRLGLLLKASERFDEAEDVFRQAIRLNPDLPDGFNQLALLLEETGRDAEAEQAYRQALHIKPDAAEIFANLAHLLKEAGRLQEAETAFREAIRIKPDYCGALNNLGVLLNESNRSAEAEAVFRQALATQPDHPEVLSNLGAMLHNAGRFEEAEAAYRRALNAQPNHAGVWCNMGALLNTLGRFKEAEAAFRQTLRLAPDNLQAFSNLGGLLYNSARFDEAEAAYEQALQINPFFPVARANRGYLNLLRGNFEQGWEDHEYRWEAHLKEPRRELPRLLWDGQPFPGKTLFIHCEQGLGDSLQFFRYLPLLAAKGGRLVVRCPPPLERLFEASASGNIHILAQQESLPDFAMHSPLLTLPLLFNTRLDTIPADIPYLKTPPDAIANCPTLPAAGLKVGLVWAGSPTHDNDRNRSVDLALLEPLFAVPGITWVILQKDRRPDGFASLVGQHGWIDPMGKVADFADTAAIVEQLDLVIGVDTSVIHLAGALGKPVWLLLPVAPDWRWLLDRDDSPWYPTLRLFRQTTPGGWTEVVRRVADALLAWAGGSCGNAAPHLEDSYALAVGHCDAGRQMEAEAALRATVKARPSHAEAWYRLGKLLKETGRAGEAEAAYRQALAAQPDYADAWLNLGNLQLEADRLDEAEATYRSALRVKPDFIQAYSNLGNLLQFNERLDEAEATYRQALAIRPDFLEALNNLGILLIETDRFAEAEALLRQASQIKPDDPEIQNNLGIALHKADRLDKAEAAFRAALRIKPDYAEVYNNLAALLAEMGRYGESEIAFQQALSVAPDDHEMQNNLAVVLIGGSRLDEAGLMLQQAQQTHPDDAMLLANQGYLHLLQGNFEQGWAEYEYRWASLAKQHQVRFAKPQWDGGPLAGKTLLLYCEQGFGDSLQFFRYLPRLAAQGGRLVLHCLPPLFRLFKASAPKSVQIVQGEEALPDFDLHCSLLSLPLRCNTRLDTIPAEIPYLKTPPDALANRLALPGDGLKVGVAWAGNPSHKNDRNRSVDLALLEPLFAVPGITWVILQKDRRPEGFASLVGQRGWIDPMDKVADFADTAAIVEALDLVIGVDTALIHLAGALGKQAWLLLPATPDWRWLLERDDSPWYPTLRLFRQTTRGDWAEVVRRVADALPAYAAGLSSPQ